MVNLQKLRRIHHSPINPDLLFLPSLDIKEKPQTTCKQKQGQNNLLRKSAHGRHSTRIQLLQMVQDRYRSVCPLYRRPKLPSALSENYSFHMNYNLLK